MRLSVVCLFVRLISIKIMFAFSMSMPQKSGTKCEQVAWLVTPHSIDINDKYCQNKHPANTKTTHIKDIHDVRKAHLPVHRLAPFFPSGRI